MKTAYFDCFAGAGGDMIAASMLDAGLDVNFLKDQLNSLGIEGLVIETSEVDRCGIKALTFKPIAPEQKKHRHLKDITQLIQNSAISDNAKQHAIRIFNTLAEVEGKIHNTSPEKIHFHEVGAIDSIIDIVSACIGFEALEIEKVYCSTISVGSGTVKCDHGEMPVPAPATAEIIKRSNMPIQAGPAKIELFTPTAAAILTEFTSEYGVIPSMQIESIGYGAGTYSSDELANVLRLLIGDLALENAESDSICLLETNIDDATGEMIGFVMDGLFERAALDVFSDPILMKQNRPAVKLSVLCRIEDIQKMEDFLFSEGITIGIRKQIIQRSKLQREFVNVKIGNDRVRIKQSFYKGKITSAKPEYSDCVKIAKKQDVPLKSIMEKAALAYNKKCGVKSKKQS